MKTITLNSKATSNLILSTEMRKRIKNNFVKEDHNNKEEELIDRDLDILDKALSKSSADINDIESIRDFIYHNGNHILKNWCIEQRPMWGTLITRTLKK